MKFSIRFLFFTLSLLCGIAPNISIAGLDGGITAYRKEDFATALRELTPLALQGNAVAQHGLGTMYATGRGVPQDDKKAVKWFRLAADQGDDFAQADLGAMYADGRGITRDYKKALQWLRLAADQEIPSARARLGLMYLRGEGVTEDYKEALNWYRLAADQGYPEAQSQLGAMYATGLGVLQDYKEAVKWFRLAADQGSARAQSYLADIYANGEGVTQDYKEAVKWYRLAAEQEDSVARKKLGEMYENGTGVPKNPIVAYALYALSSGMNSERLADSMTPAEIKVAEEWFPEIEKQGSLLKALDLLSKNTLTENPPETVKQQLSPIGAPQSSSYASYGVDSLWVAMILIWAIAEGIGALKKKEFRKRLQSAAIWSVMLTSIATVGLMNTEQNALFQLAVCLALYGTAAGVFFFARVTLNALWQKKKSNPLPGQP